MVHLVLHYLYVAYEYKRMYTVASARWTERKETWMEMEIGMETKLQLASGPAVFSFSIVEKMGQPAGWRRATDFPSRIPNCPPAAAASWNESMEKQIHESFCSVSNHESWKTTIIGFKGEKQSGIGIAVQLRHPMSAWYWNTRCHGFRYAFSSNGSSNGSFKCPAGLSSFPKKVVVEQNRNIFVEPQLFGSKGADCYNFNDVIYSISFRNTSELIGEILKS